MKKMISLRELENHLDKDMLENTYVFGSLLNSVNPKDVDILIVYNPLRHPFHVVLQIRKLIENTVLKSISLSGHVQLLSMSEEKEVKFIKNQKCVPLKIYYEKTRHMDG